jgi:hypothetical protein
MKRALFTVTFLMASFHAVAAQGWRQPQTLNGSHYTEVSAAGHTPDGQALTTLTVQCYGGRNGYISFTYGIHQAGKIRSFDFTPFDGKDVPASDEKLVNVTARTKKMDYAIKTSVNGGMTNRDRPDVFEFSFGANINTRSAAMRLAQVIRRGVSVISVRVQAFRDPARAIYTDFPTSGAAEAVSKTLRACGKR